MWAQIKLTASSIFTSHPLKVFGFSTSIFLLACENWHSHTMVVTCSLLWFSNHVRKVGGEKWKSMTKAISNSIFDTAAVKKMIPKLFFYPCVCKWFGDIANEFDGKHFVNQELLR